MVVAKKDELRQHEDSGDISPGQGIGDTVGGWGSFESFFAKRQEWLKQAMGEIAVATMKGPADKWGSFFLTRVSQSWRPVKKSLGRRQRERIAINGSRCCELPLIEPRRHQTGKFHTSCLEKSRGIIGFVIFRHLPCSLAM